MGYVQEKKILHMVDIMGNPIGVSRFGKEYREE